MGGAPVFEHPIDILVIEPQPDIAPSLSLLLAATEYQIRGVSNEQAALDFIQSIVPDIVLLDADLADMGSYRICSRLKAEALDTSILFIGTSTKAAQKVEAFAVGGADYIVKPFQVEEVLARIQYQMVLRQQRQQFFVENQTLRLEVQELSDIEAALKQQARQEQLLGKMTQRIRQSLQLEQILNAAVSEVRQLLQADRALIYRFNPDWSGEVVIESVISNDLSLLDRSVYDSCLENRWNEPYLHGHIGRIEDVDTGNFPPCYIALLKSLRVQANLVFPILQKERLWGLLITHQCFAPRSWQAWEIHLLKELANQLAIAIQQSELYEKLQAANQELQRLANLDGLTQVANRRHFDSYIGQEWRRLQREQSPLSLIFCDVDSFKFYNDYYGHQAGDMCLQQIAKALISTIKRPADLVARYGGEEFAVILPNTALQGAIQVAEQMQQAIADLKLPHAQSQIDRFVTVSIGIASMVPPRKVSSTCLVAAADRALYVAKAQGRNTYRIAEST